MIAPAAPLASRAGLTALAALVAFVAGARIVRLLHPALFTDPDSSWRVERLLLWGALLAVTGAVFWAARRLLLRLGGSSPLHAPADPLPASRRGLLALGAAAFAAGAVLRFVALETVPFALWLDDTSLVGPTLALRGAPSDLSPLLRDEPFGIEPALGTISVLYLELYRLSLLVWGTSILGIRFPSALAGVASLLTVALLGRTLLPRGGGALALVVLAGARWHLVLSRWSWNALVIEPMVDVAGWLLVRARRSGRLGPVLLAGLLAGLACHFYLSGWIASAALFLLALWPGEEGRGWRAGARRAGSFLAGVLLVTAPILVSPSGGAPGAFRRAAQNVVVEARRAGSVWPAVDVASDALLSPWTLEPQPRDDLPGRSRLGPFLGLLAAVGLARAFTSPRRDVSAFLLCHAAAAVAGAVAGGGLLYPTGYRFAYVSGVLALAAASGGLALVTWAGARRRAASVALLSALALAGALGAKEALVVWPRRRDVFESLCGAETLLGRAALRWKAYGEVSLAPDLWPRRPVVAEAVARFGILPREEGRRRAETLPAARLGSTRFEVRRPGEAPPPGRVVERVVDGWGRTWGVVVALPPAPAGPPVE